jgi:hypothetical protein
MARSLRSQPALTAKAYQQIPVADMTGGVDLRQAQTLLGPDRARTLINFSLAEPGALAVRPGYQKWSTTSLGAGRMQGAARVYLNTALPSVNSTAFQLAAYQGGVYLGTDSGGWANSSAAVLTGLSTGNEIFFPHDRDMVAALDGSTTPWKSTNGSSWTKMGIRAGSSGPVLSSLSTGQLVSASEYEIAYTYKDRDLAYESNGSSNQSTYTMGSTGGINVIVPNSTDPQVDAIVVYARNKTAGEAIRRKISSQVQSAGTHSTIAIVSSAWSLNNEEPSDHTVPPALAFGVVWKNRWWARDAIVKNRLRFTQLFQPQSWPSLFFVDIPFSRGDEIRAIDAIGDALIIHGTTKSFVIVGQTSLDFEVRPSLGSQAGALGPRATAQVENSLIHADASGVYSFDGATDRLLSLDLEPAWRDLIKNGSIFDLERIAMVYDSLRKEVRISVPRRYPSGTWGEWVLDLNRSNQADGQTAWTATDRTIGGYVAWDGPEQTAGNRGKVLTWHSSVARLFEENVGTSANSSNLTAEYEGPGLTLGARRGRWVDLRGEYEPNTGAFTVEASIDGVTVLTRSLSIGAGLSVYGTGTYGTATYAGAGRRQFYTVLPLNADGRTYVQKLQYSGMQSFKVLTYSPGFVPETRARDFGE